VLSGKPSVRCQSRTGRRRAARGAARGSLLGTLAHQEWIEAKVGRALRLLGECPEEERAWEWHYLMRLCHSDRFTLRGHRQAVRALALSPDGRYLATGSSDQSVMLWDAETGRELRTLRGHEGGITDLAFRPDGLELASSDDRGVVKLWRLSDGALLQSRFESNVAVQCVAFGDEGPPGLG
jgi:WD40 repeat protein